MDKKITRIQELLENDDFGKELENLETIEEFQAAFKNHGVELTLEEVDALLVQVAQTVGGELDESALENISGGVVVSAFILGGVGVAVGRAVAKYIKNKRR